MSSTITEVRTVRLPVGALRQIEQLAQQRGEKPATVLKSAVLDWLSRNNEGRVLGDQGAAFLQYQGENQF